MSSTSEKVLYSAQRAASVTPADSTAIGDVRAVYVGGAGDLACDMDGTTVTFAGVPAGTLLPIRPYSINSTSTTATSIVRIW